MAIKALTGALPDSESHALQWYLTDNGFDTGARFVLWCPNCRGRFDQVVYDGEFRLQRVAADLNARRYRRAREIPRCGSAPLTEGEGAA